MSSQETSCHLNVLRSSASTSERESADCSRIALCDNFLSPGPGRYCAKAHTDNAEMLCVATPTNAGHTVAIRQFHQFLSCEPPHSSRLVHEAASSTSSSHSMMCVLSALQVLRMRTTAARSLSIQSRDCCLIQMYATSESTLSSLEL